MEISVTGYGKRRTHTAWITYIAGGKEHTVKLDYYSYKMKVGDEVKLLVNYTNPEDFMFIGKGANIIPIMHIFCIIIGMLSILIIYFLILGEYGIF